MESLCHGLSTMITHHMFELFITSMPTKLMTLDKGYGSGKTDTRYSDLHY